MEAAGFVFLDILITKLHFYLVTYSYMFVGLHITFVYVVVARLQLVTRRTAWNQLMRG